MQERVARVDPQEQVAARDVDDQEDGGPLGPSPVAPVLLHGFDPPRVRPGSARERVPRIRPGAADLEGRGARAYVLSGRSSKGVESTTVVRVWTWPFSRRRRMSSSRCPVVRTLTFRT